MPQGRKEILEGMGRNPQAPYKEPDPMIAHQQYGGMVHSPMQGQPRASLHPWPMEMLAPKVPAPTEGLVVPGNIQDLIMRRVLHNPGGGYSTTTSESTQIEDPRHPYYKHEVLVPTVVNGVRLTMDQAMDRFYRTGEHLGIFGGGMNLPDKERADMQGRLADAYATWLHNEQTRQAGMPP
jgi:hypothetical protein